jgi:hypothetical protein
MQASSDPFCDLSQAAALVGTSEDELREFIRGGKSESVSAGEAAVDATHFSASELDKIRTGLLLQSVFEVMEHPVAWLDMPNPWLGGLPPRQLLGTDREQLVRDIVEGIKYGNVA